MLRLKLGVLLIISIDSLIIGPLTHIPNFISKHQIDTESTTSKTAEQDAKDNDQQESSCSRKSRTISISISISISIDVGSWGYSLRFLGCVRADLHRRAIRPHELDLFLLIIVQEVPILLELVA